MKCPALVRLAMAAFLLAPGFVCFAVETPEPTPEGIRIAMDAARHGVTWLVFKDWSKQEIVGHIQIQEPIVKFTNRGGTLFSVKLDDVDLAETERFNKLVKAGRWIDPATAAWSKVRVRQTKASVSDMLTQFLRLTSAIDTAMEADFAASCGGYQGEVAQGLCAMDRGAQISAEVAARLGQ